LRNFYVKLQHLKAYLGNARARAIRDNIPFNLVLQDLEDIATDQCPIFHTPFVWGQSGLGKGKTRPDSPTLDRVLPELGYVKGNVVFLSYRANRIKDNGTMQEHYDIADFIWNHINAKKKSTSSVPAGTNSSGELYPELGTFSAVWVGKNTDSVNNHSGAIRGQDTDHSAQASSGDGMGAGDAEMATFESPASIQVDGKPKPKISWVKLGCGHLPD